MGYVCRLADSERLGQYIPKIRQADYLGFLRKCELGVISNLKENMHYYGRSLLNMRPRKRMEIIFIEKFWMGHEVYIFIIMKTFSVKHEGIWEGKTGGRNFLGGYGSTLERDILDWNRVVEVIKS